ncbi:MAG TPA: dephospho-CoA kinase [Treponemataceae bacterium]|nr:dephospho-CoA kinase [Treponemataceae bacterium]
MKKARHPAPTKGALPVIGLTGPMSSGKNVAGAILERLGFAVVDSDQTAHQALIDVQDSVLAAFSGIARDRGLTLLTPEGCIDRRALGALLFSDPALLARHEAIIYPRINALLSAFIDEHAAAGSKTPAASITPAGCNARAASDSHAERNAPATPSPNEKAPLRGIVINAPLLHKSPVLDRCNFVIFVDSPLLMRLVRARKRDKLPFRQILARFSAQKHLFAQYRAKNVDIQRVQNRGSIRALEKRLVILLSRRGY